MQRFFPLPNEIILNILNKADAKTVCSFEQVSQSAKILAEDESLWKTKFKTDFQFDCDDIKEFWEEINKRAADQELTFKKLYSYFVSCRLNEKEKAAIEHMGIYGVTENNLKWFHINNKLQGGIEFGEIHFSLLACHLRVLDDINRCEVITPSLHAVLELSESEEMDIENETEGYFRNRYESQLQNILAAARVSKIDQKNILLLLKGMEGAQDIHELNKLSDNAWDELCEISQNNYDISYDINDTQEDSSEYIDTPKMKL